jgi:hypothetical protein
LGNFRIFFCGVNLNNFAAFYQFSQNWKKKSIWPGTHQCTIHWKPIMTQLSINHKLSQQGSTLVVFYRVNAPPSTSCKLGNLSMYRDKGPFTYRVELSIFLIKLKKDILRD